MDKKKFFEAIYAACTDEIVSRRRGLMMPFCVLLTGVVLLFLQSHFFKASDDILRISLFLLGIVSIVLSAFLTYNRLLGEGEPYSLKEKKFLSVATVSFDLSQKQIVLETLKSGNMQEFYNIPRNGISAISVMIAKTFDETTVVAMVFQYVDLEYVPVSDILVVHQSK